MRRMWSIAVLLALLVLGVGHAPVVAQDEAGRPLPTELTVFTSYPDQSAEIGETVTIELTLRAPEAQVVQLDVTEVPEGWTASFTGGGRVVQSVYVEPQTDATVTLRLEPAEEVAAGDYAFVVAVQGTEEEAELPIAITVQERLPSRLTFDVELPTLRGGPTTTFRYDATLTNEGDEETTVNLVAEAQPGFLVTFQLTGQEVTSFPIGPGETRNVTIEVTPPPEVAAGQYQVGVTAQSDEAQEQIVLTAEVTGQAELAVTTPDERLSGQAYAGQVTPFTVVLRNDGSAPAQNVTMGATPPGGWSVTFQPEQVAEVPPGQEVEVTVNVQPAEKAVAGDYMLEVRATPEGGTAESVDIRVTVLTSTIWGIVAIGLIALAVGVVGLAVMRFGRR